MEKIAIIGSPGSGKSTLARELGGILVLPVVHLDRIYHKNDGTTMPRDGMDHFQRELVSGKKWIVDGNYQRTLDIRLGAADTIIFLDYPKRISIWRAIIRTWTYRNKQQPDIIEGFEQKVRIEFLKRIWNYPRAETLEKIERFRESKDIYIFKNPTETKSFLDGLRRNYVN